MYNMAMGRYKIPFVLNKCAGASGNISIVIYNIGEGIDKTNMENDNSCTGKIR